MVASRLIGPKVLVVILLLLFWSLSIRHLAAVPRVYEDEPWQASTAWKLANEGIFGSDLFTGFYGMEEHYYGFMPLHPVLLAGLFHLTGLGIFQARFEPVIMGVLTLALTYSLGKRLFRPEIGLLAVFLLLLTRTTGTTPSQISGILFIDIPRISRYDMLVPVLGLLALHACWSALGGRQESRLSPTRQIVLFFLSGLLVGLAGLSHLYGIFWLPPLFLLVLWLRSGWTALVAMGLGFLIPWFPYLAYLWQAPADWVGQTRDYTPRFQLFSPGWYIQNLLNEPRRYGPGLGSPGWGWLLRPGFWAFIIVVPVSLLALGRQAYRGNRAAAALFIPGLVLPLLFALLIYLKLANYLVTVFPLLALTAAWGLWQLWHRTGEWAARKPVLPIRLVRYTLLILLFAVTLEGVGRLYLLEVTASNTTAYDEFIADVREHLPEKGRLLGLHHYWLGMSQYDYRSWAVPILQADPHYWTPPLTVAQALDRIEPDIILIDGRMVDFFAERPDFATAVEEWLTGRRYSLEGQVEDEIYGQVSIYLAPGVNSR